MNLDKDGSYQAVGDRFLDFMAFQAGYLKLDDIIDLKEFTYSQKVKAKGKTKLERILFRPEESLF